MSFGAYAMNHAYGSNSALLNTCHPSTPKHYSQHLLHLPPFLHLHLHRARPVPQPPTIGRKHGAKPQTRSTPN